MDKLDRLIEGFQDLDTLDRGFMDFSERDIVDQDEREAEQELLEVKTERGDI